MARVLGSPSPFGLLLTFCLGYSHAVLVKVEQGTLRGTHEKARTGLCDYYSFKGIPYAEPPVKELRFKSPKPHKGWDGIRDASKNGNVCPQFDQFTGILIPGDEDCLFLNVYTPSMKPDKPMPVIFFIHGGGYQCGSGDDTNYGPDFLMNYGVVLVTINYRLDVFGFLKMDTKEVPGNAGLRDQALALKWVRDNIDKFGGDPDSITLMGQSAGGTSVLFHTMSPVTKGMFKRAIAMSGTPFCEWSPTLESRRRAFALGKFLGKDTDDDNELLEFLQSVDKMKLINTRQAIISPELVWNNGIKMYSFQPAVEKDVGQERFLVESPQECLENNNTANVDLLIGYTSLEYLVGGTGIYPVSLTYKSFPELYVPMEVLRKVPPNQFTKYADRVFKHYYGDKKVTEETVPIFVQYASDLVFTYGINRFVRNAHSYGKTYLYKFYPVSLRNRYSIFGLPYGISAAGHTDDLRYLFDAKSDIIPVSTDSREFKLIKQICELFTNFVKYGNPTPDDSLGAVWPEFNHEDIPYLMINDTLVPGTHLDDEVVEFWQGVLRDGGNTMV